jgi:SH3-like domain-containing protein
MRHIQNISLGLLALLFAASGLSLAQEEEKTTPCLFQGEVTSNNINVRTDSTAGATAICKVNRGEPVEVMQEAYGWYKIRLPAGAPSFVKQDLLEPIDDKTAKVSGNSVNIRLKPDTSSAILGKLKDEGTVNVISSNGGWCQIEPTPDSYGWIHKSFVKKTEKTKSYGKKAVIAGDKITVEGVIRPKVFTRVASYKLIAEGKVYLLRGDAATLDSFIDRKVSVSGTLSDPTKQKYPIIEIANIEALD